MEVQQYKAPTYVRKTSEAESSSVSHHGQLCCSISPSVTEIEFFTSLTFPPVSNICSGPWDLLRTAQGKQEKRAIQAAAAKKLQDV